MPLTDLSLRDTYDPDVCPDPVGEFYSPTLAESVTYDRDTFTFTAKGLTAAAAGLAGLLRNDGRVRIVCEPTGLSEETRQAIIDGHEQALLDAVPPEDLTSITESDIRVKGQLDVITWLVAQGRLEIRVALPKTPEQGIFHPKTGIMADADGNRVSFDGSPNETEAGWGRNYERFHLFRSWREPDRVKDDVEHFDRLWNNQSNFLHVIPVPEAYSEHLKAAAPTINPLYAHNLQTDEGIKNDSPTHTDQRNAYWQRIREAIRNDPATTAATVPAELWPHQAAFFNRHAAGPGPDRLLIADEVGLGKTIQAGILLKARLNQGRVKRLLILAPKPACRQWQDELRYKFCLNVPVLETGGRPRLAYPDGTQADAPYPPWAEDTLIASYQWLRQHIADFMESEPQYDMVIVDEAHRARFSEVANANRRRPNRYLELLRQLAMRTEGLLLLTATPMQLHEAELHALLELLEPTGWSAEDFRRFYDEETASTPEDWRFMAEHYRPLSPNPQASDERLIHSRNRAYVSNQLTPEVIEGTASLMRDRSPAKRRMSRHTRETLRRYARVGRISATIPERRVHPIAIPMTDAERRLYEDIDDLVNEVYASAPGVNATAMGFIMTTYRRRLGSSPRAFAQTCRNHIQRQQANADAWREISRLDEEEQEDYRDEPLPGTTLAPRAIARLEQAARDAGQLERRDSKLRELRNRLTEMAADGHRKIIIFTQFRDTMLYLADRLTQQGHSQVTCVSGQDDPAQGNRAERIGALRDASEGLLICTETASESLNLQFCTAMVNYDIPWNPMTLEQRIGRIDRIRQERPEVDIVNLFYEDTAEWDAYEAMRERLTNIHGHVGKYQPILYDPATASQLAGIIRTNAGSAATRDAVGKIESEPRLNLDILNSSLDNADIAVASVTMTYLQRMLEEPNLLPDGWQAEPAGGLHWRVQRPDGEWDTVTTDRASYEYAPQHIEWFGPGSPVFPEPHIHGYGQCADELEDDGAGTATDRETFERLADEWERNRPRGTDVEQMTQHPAYQSIINMGEPAVPWLLQRMAEKPDHWFVALNAITGARPVPAESRGRIKEMVQAWLDWGRHNGYDFE